MSRGSKYLSAMLVGGALMLGAASANASTVIPKTVATSAAPASQVLTFSVYLPLRNQPALKTFLTSLQTQGSASYHKWLTPAQFNAQYGPTAASVSNVTSALQGLGFTILGVQGRGIQVSGTVAVVTKAFSTSLVSVQPQAGPASLVSTTPLVVPAALKAESVTVPAFTSAVPRLKTHSRNLGAVTDPDNRFGAVGGYYFTDLKQAYDYPSYQSTLGNGARLDGTGVNVAVLMSSDALDTDVQAMFDHEKFTTVGGTAAPTINHVPVDQSSLSFTSAFDESSLDVQQVLGGAPGAKVSLIDIPDLYDNHIMDGYNYIINQTKAGGGALFQVVNSSFGGCEIGYTAAYNGGVDFTYVLDQYEAMFEQGNAEGITFVASSGDEGGLECPDTNYFTNTPTGPSRFIASVSFPASSPSVTAVGGTNLLTSASTPPSLTSTYAGENALGDPEVPYDIYGFGVNVSGGYWGAGGGLSAYFAKPAYQAVVTTGSTTARTLPDVGMQVGGCPGGISVQPCGPNRSYVITFLQGGRYGLIGTSVASPEFVGAVALYDQINGGGAGNLNYYLYAKSAQQNTTPSLASYHRYIPGFDGKWTNTYPAGGYDYLVGNGTPDVRQLFGMATFNPAGDPQTATNP